MPQKLLDVLDGNVELDPSLVPTGASFNLAAGGGAGEPQAKRIKIEGTWVSGWQHGFACVQKNACMQGLCVGWRPPAASIQGRGWSGGGGARLCMACLARMQRCVRDAARMEMVCRIRGWAFGAYAPHGCCTHMRYIGKRGIPKA